jgi:pimeloyl-ACP methyl ester carboxylesterase
MTTFVLLHGMCHGGWCWSRVVPLLRAGGHEVFTPTQTGLGERAHLLSAAITLETFVDDVVGVLEAEELTDVVLVGHSFGGNAISGAAHRVPGRLRHLVYLDGVVPLDGVSPLDASDPAVAAARRALAAETGNVSIAAPDPGVFGVPAGPDAHWVHRRMTPHPFGTLTSSLLLPGGPNNGLPATYVCCTDPLYAALAWARERARQLPGWAWREIAAGHDCMVTAPRETADLLMEIAA